MTDLNTDVGDAVVLDTAPATTPAAEPAATPAAEPATTLGADATDEQLDAALAADPNLHTVAVDRAGASFQAALQALTDNPTPGGGHPAHLLGFEKQRYWPRIGQGVQSLSRIVAVAGADTAVVASTKRDLLRTALKMGGVFDRIADPATRDQECDRIWCAQSPGAFVRPFKKPPVPKDGDIAPVPHHLHPATLAREALTRWKGRGILVERDGDSLKLTGHVHDGDRATAAQLKAEILALLPQPVTV